MKRWHGGAAAAGAAPGDPLPLAYGCLALILDDRHERALETLGSAGGAAADHPAALAVAARALYETGRHQEAYDRCRKACEADPQCSAAWLYAGMACEAMGRAGEAAEAYERAGAGEGCGGDDDLACGAGDAGKAHALCRTGRYAEAAELLGGGGAAGSKDARVCCLAGMALSKAGRGGEAAACLKAAASSRPANSDGLYYAALASYMLGRDGDERRYDEALKSLKQALSRNRKSSRAAALAEKAREAIRAGAERRRASAERIAQAAREEEVRRAEEEARRRREGRAAGGGGGDAAAERSRELKRRERERRRAEEERRRRAERAAQAAASARAAGLSREGRFEEAVELFGRTAPMPDDHAGWDAMARALYGLGRYREAVDCFKRAHPGGGGADSPDVLAAIAANSVREGRKRQFEEGHMAISHYNDALYRIERALGADAGHHEALVLGGMVNMYTANIGEMPGTSEDGALGMFERASKSDYYDAQALYHTGRILERRCEAEGARAMYGAVALCKARRLEDHYCIGRALDAVGRFGDARAHYMEGIRRDPEYRGLCEEIARGGGDGARAQPRDRSGTAVVDTNVAMPCLVTMCADGCILPASVTNKAYFAARLAGGQGADGEVIVPWACKGEIVNNLDAFLSRMQCHQDHNHVVSRIKGALKDIPSEHQKGIKISYADSLRVMRMYWRAWLDMDDCDKMGWQERKKANGRLFGGGPPDGAVDTKVLAIAAKVAADQSKTVTLYSDDEDFGAFKKYIAGIGVDVRPV